MLRTLSSLRMKTATTPKLVSFNRILYNISKMNPTPPQLKITLELKTKITMELITQITLELITKITLVLKTKITPE